MILCCYFNCLGLLILSLCCAWHNFHGFPCCRWFCVWISVYGMCFFGVNVSVFISDSFVFVFGIFFYCFVFVCFHVCLSFCTCILFPRLAVASMLAFSCYMSQSQCICSLLLVTCFIWLMFHCVLLWFWEFALQRC